MTKAYFRYDKDAVILKEGQPNDHRIFYLSKGTAVAEVKDNVVNTYLDIEIGASTLVADWCYICDFDHRTEDVTYPIKDQGIVKSPVRIGPDTWIGVKASVLRGAFIGRGTVVAAHAVVRDGEYPELAILGGVPARVLKDRNVVYLEQAATREALADIARKHERAAHRARELKG